MKVGILTQPLEDNYGGILQAYALQYILDQLDIDSEVINRVDDDAYDRPWSIRLRHLLGRIYRFPTHRNVRKIFRPYYIEQRVRNKLYQHTYRFIDQYIHISPRLNTNNKFLAYILENEYDGFVVGSDQCWRPKYSPNIYTYFLNFCESWNDLKRISYGASFGVNFWEFTDEETRICSQLIQKFDAVSVREDSGINLCSKHLGYNSAVQVLDPTLLLSKEDYLSNLSILSFPKSTGNLLTYILDPTDVKAFLIEKVSMIYGLSSFSVVAPHSYQDEHCYPISECIQPPLEHWLRGFYDAQFTIVDSFHGCVFSIIFNKPFIVIANEERGLTRMESLLRIFDLTDRIVIDPTAVDESIYTRPINWINVNKKLEMFRRYSIRFLKDNLL